MSEPTTHRFCKNRTCGVEVRNDHPTGHCREHRAEGKPKGKSTPRRHVSAPWPSTVKATMSFSTKNTGQNLKRIRRAVGLSQEELGERMGVSAGWISRVESGDTKASAERVLEFCTIFEVTPNEFYAEHEEFLTGIAVR